ncbi:hypothetical protein SHM_13010 [Spiroplasma ixodetis]|uniref:Uncharacterized protein n=1 Tax=Spiroplasma ixodetis TaxID=2141 RepID=A0ABM8BUV4_9MOLU|nr:hypothetical protein SHM_13010 [Spiroplasma ixodetis]
MPVKLSLQAIRISFKPRFFISVKLDNQNLEPSFSLIHNPKTWMGYTLLDTNYVDKWTNLLKERNYNYDQY